MMRVTVKDHPLNVRQGKPSVNAPIVRTLSPGSEIEVDGKLYKGDLFEGISTWAKDDGENYYWSGGTNFLSRQTSLVEITHLSNIKFNYNALLVLDQKYKQTEGENITIALIDTGCSRHKALGDSILRTHNVLNNSDDAIDKSNQGHGTFLTGLIGARNHPANEIIGIAPKSKLIIVKAVEDTEVSMLNVLAALNWINELTVPPDIINLSLDFSPGTKKQEFDIVISALISRGVILVAAGQEETGIYSNAIFYPANDERVVGIGAISSQHVTKSAINSALAFVLPNKNFLSLRPFGNLYKDGLTGCSISSAIASGVLALIMSFLKKNAPAESGVTHLSAAATSLTAETLDDMLKIYK